jgi:signal peptidase I
MLMKRIIGLPGETVLFRHGRVFVNDVVLEEPYLKNPCDWERVPDTLGPNEYFVVGDNRSMPIEDHRFGKTEDFRIVGKVVLCKNLFASWLQ